jgi:DNA-binding XRE family transcriptional regulator
MTTLRKHPEKLGIALSPNNTPVLPESEILCDSGWPKSRAGVNLGAGMVIEDSAWWFLKTMGRTYRNKSGRTQKQVGDAIPRSEDTVRAWELGRSDIPIALAEAYGKACGMDAERAGYMRMVATARKVGLPIEADMRYNAMFLALSEEYSCIIFKWDALLIPGPLQTREFHYTVVRRTAPDASDHEIDKGWKFKQERAKTLEARTDCPTMHFLIGEAALFFLRRSSEDLYQAQMDLLRQWARRPGVSVRILQDPVPAHIGSFSIYYGSGSSLCDRR